MKVIKIRRGFATVFEKVTNAGGFLPLCPIRGFWIRVRIFLLYEDSLPIRLVQKGGVSNIPANKLFEIQIRGRVLIQNALIIGDIKLLGENQILLQRFY